MSGEKEQAASMSSPVKPDMLDNPQFVPVPLVLEDAEVTAQVIVPAKLVDGKTEEEIQRIARDVLERAAVARKNMDQEELKRLSEEYDLLEAALEGAAVVVAGEAVECYLRKTKGPRKSPLPKRESTPDQAIRIEMLRQRLAPLTAHLKEQIRGLIPADAREQLQAYIFQYQMAWTLLEMEQDPAAKDLKDVEEATKLFNTYYRRQDPQITQQYLLFYSSRDLARTILDRWALERKSVEELRDFLGPVADQDWSIWTAVDTVPLPAPFSERPFLSVLNAWLYHDVGAALSKNTFRHKDGTPWPTALLNRGNSTGYVQLRPAAVSDAFVLSPEQTEEWAKRMWQYQAELSDLDADVLDCLSANWLSKARRPEDDALIAIDDILKMRGLQPKQGGRGHRGGFRQHQREEVIKALQHIQDLWITMGELEIYSDGKGKGKRTREAVQSRPFVMTDRVGQLTFDGNMTIRQLIYRPGKVFASYLFGSGRQVALLHAKALQYNPKTQYWEKRLTRYLCWIWRNRAKSGRYMVPTRVVTILQAVEEDLDTRRLSRLRERLEKALDKLKADDIIAAWQYERWNEADKNWLDWTILIEPPDQIKEHYQKIDKEQGRPRQVPSEVPPQTRPLGERMKERRKLLRISQLKAAETLGIEQAYVSKIESGVANPSATMRRKIELWLDGRDVLEEGEDE